MNEIKIKKSWFYSAGDRYNWTKDGLDKRGVGVAKNALYSEDELIVEVEGKKYYLNCVAGRAFGRKYKSQMIVKGNPIYVLSKSVLEEVNQ